MEVLEIILILILTICPALGLLWMVYKRDFIYPEPSKNIGITFLFGLLAIIPPIIIGYFIIPLLIYPIFGSIIFSSPLVFLLIESFIFAGLIEEVSKIVSFRMSSWSFEDFNEIVDGIVYGVTISLGFATIENLWYGYQFTTLYSSFQSVLLNISLRAVTAVPAHAIIGGVMGYYLGKAKVRNSGGYAFGGLLLAIFLHGLYDVFAIGIQLFPIIIENAILGYILGWAGVIIFLLIGLPGLFNLIKKARAEGPRID